MRSRAVSRPSGHWFTGGDGGVECDGVVQHRFVVSDHGAHRDVHPQSRCRCGHEARIHLGPCRTIAGIGVAFLMTGPTAEQLADFQGVAGAPTVGSQDGGPGIPLFGWSTVAGDLRVPHFVGLHALQLIPLAVFFLRTKISVSVVDFIGVGYLIVVGLLTAQALAGQSIAAPSPAFALGIIAAIAVPLTAALIRGPRAETDVESQRSAPS